jgi:hypothetical protein
MISFSPDVLKRIALDFFDYPITDDAAIAVAASASAMLNDLRGMAALDLTGIEPAFSYVTMRSEADRIRGAKASR